MIRELGGQSVFKKRVLEVGAVGWDYSVHQRVVLQAARGWELLLRGQLKLHGSDSACLRRGDWHRG